MNFFKPRKLIAALVLGASATCALAHPPTVDVRVGVRPPPMRAERVPGPRAGYMWTHGYWGWSGGAHVWIGGHWEADRPGFHYYEPRWLFVDGAWAFYPGYWEPYAVAPVVVVQQPQMEYVEKPQDTQNIQSAQSTTGATPGNFDPHFWYYCRNPAGYYPYVQDCPAGWQQVTPTPPGQ